MNQDSVFINDRSNDLGNNEYQKCQKKDNRNSETTTIETQHLNVYNGNEGGGKCHQQIKNGLDGMTKTGDNPTKRKLENIEERIESTISLEGKDRISNILNDVNRLSDVEKFLLYLKLPTGSQSEDVLRQTPTSALHSSNRAEQAQAFTWIRSHLEEDNEICVPKHEVFEDYKEYCDSHDRKSLCAADFGKVMKCVFPNVKARRLGQRGQSRYCYSGLRKKLEVQPPALPELEVCPRKLKDEGNEEDELFLASCQLVCEWAQKLIGSHFNSLSELSEHLVGNHYVNSKSMAAFTVLAAMQDSGTHNSKVPASVLFSSPSTGNKHRETQLQLQKKLQEREILKEQKKILQQQRFENEQEHEQLLQAKGLTSMPKTTKSSFQTGKGGAIRDISKLLQSPHKESRQRSLSESTSSEGSIISSNGRNTVDISVLNCVKSTDNDSSVLMCSDNINSANSHHNYSVIYTDKSRSSSTSSTSSSQQLYVQNSSVIKIVGQNIEDNRSESQAMDTNEKENDHGPISNYAICVDKSISSENNIFILPSNTPSNRSAFVPVSNQRKEQAFLNDPSSNIGVPVVTLSEKIQNDQEMPDTIRSENHPLIVDPPITVLKHDNQGQQSKSLSPQTPRKSTKNRFTPIKPKGVPTNIAKQPIETPTYDSRPVSTILKEKRAKEAKETIQGISIQATSQQGTTLPVVSPQFLRIPASSVGTKTNDVLIILASTAQQPLHVKSGSIVSQSHIVTNTAVASLATPIRFTSQITSQQNPEMVTSSFPQNLHVISSSSNQQTGSKPLISMNSTNAFNQDQTKSSQKMPSYSPSFLVSSSKSSESYIDVSDPETVVHPSECDITMLEVNRKENDTPNRKRKNSDEGSAISKRMNSMERTEHEFLMTTVRQAHNSNHSGSHHHQDQDIIGLTHTNAQIGTLSSRLNLESLEHDALLDSSSVPVDKQLYKSVTNSPKTETSSIGINAKSLRPSQKQLMREKRQLDERIHNFLNKLVDGVDDKEDSEKHVEIDSLSDFDIGLNVSKSIPRQQDKQTISIVEKPKLLNNTKPSQKEPNKISMSKPIQRTKSPEKPKQGNCHPVNLLSLLQQPIKFENPTPRNPQQRKAVVESTMVRSNKATANSNHILNRRSDDFSQSKIAEILGRPAKYREPETDHQVDAFKSLDQLSTKCSFDDNTEDGELPNDVAEFVTEALTARAQSRASNYSADGGMDSNLNDTSHSLNHSGDLLNCELLFVDPSAVVSKMNSQVSDLQEQFIVPNTPPIRQKPVDGSNPKYKTHHAQRSSTMSVFAVPSKPHANPNVILPQTRTDVISPVQISHQKCISPHDFTSPPRKAVRRMRQPSADQMTIQTPISDAGYHSFNTSPIMNSTPLPNEAVTVTESYIYLRPESAHSIITDPQIVSPISQASPQHYPSTASTPSSVISPHCLSQSSVNPSPVEYITSPNAFVPIHGLNNGVGTMIHPRIVTPIRPVVTTAADPNTGTAAASATANQLLNIMKKAPGLTKAALQTHQRLLAQQLDPSGFVSLKQNVNNYVVTTNGETVPPNLSLVNSMQLQSESPIQRSPSLSCSTPDDDRIIVSPKPKENISHQRNSSLSRPQTLPEVTKPPSYEEALKHMKRNKQKKQNVSQSSSQPVAQLDTTPTSESSQLLTRILTEETPTSNPEPVLSKVYPFSYQLALLHEKVQTPSPKQLCKPIDGDKTLYDISADINLDSPAGLLQLGSKTIDTDDLDNLQGVSGQILIDSRSLTAQNQFISDLQISSQNGTDILQNGSYLTLDLPNVNYIGSAPNIDLSNIIHKPSSKSSTVFCEDTTTESRSATIDQSNGITDIDLPPYLDILNLDGQYFSHDDLNIENLHSTLPTVSEQTSSSSSLTSSSDITYSKSARLSS